MDLLGIRTQFATLSGRLDLVDPTTFADNGADFYINEGMRMLEGMVEFPKEPKIIEVAVVADDYEATVTDCRSILQVWFVDSDGDRKQLVKKDPTQMRELYGKSWDEVDSGGVKYYCKAFGDEIVGLDGNEKGIIFMPPTDAVGNVEIIGKFYTTALVLDADENFWTLSHAYLLIQSALYQLEAGYRNTEGMKDWLGAIMPRIATIEMDTVEEDISEIDVMEG